MVHILDDSADWEQRIALTQLLDRLPSDRFTQTVAAIDSTPALRSSRIDERCVRCPARFGLPFTASPALRRLFDARRADVVHAWGVRAALAAAAAGVANLVLECFDPIEASRCVKQLRTLGQRRRLAVVCSCEIIRRRLIEGGLAPEATVVIRPGVDFAQINAARRSALRRSLALDERHHVVIPNLPASRDGGQFDTALAAVLLSYFVPHLALILPAEPPRRPPFAGARPREDARILRFLRATPHPPIVVTPLVSIPYEDLIAISDTLVIAPRGDAPTTAIAWAMGARCAVIGSAVYCVAELVAHKVNGRLFKQVPGKSMASTLAALIREQAEDEGTLRTRSPSTFSGTPTSSGAPTATSAPPLDGLPPLRFPPYQGGIEGGRTAQTGTTNAFTDAAHGQAYEVFSVRRFVDQHLRVYENLLRGAAPADGIVDSARVS